MTEQQEPTSSCTPNTYSNEGTYCIHGMGRRRPETPWCQEAIELHGAWISNHVLSTSWDFPAVFYVPHLQHLFSSTWHLGQFHILFFFFVVSSGVSMCCFLPGQEPCQLLLDVLKVQPAAPGPAAGLPVMQAPHIWLWHRHIIRKYVRLPNTCWNLFYLDSSYLATLDVALVLA